MQHSSNMQTIREEGESSCAINRSEINVGDDRPNKGGNHFDEEKLLEKEDNTIMQIISQEGESSRGMDANHSNVARGGPPKGDTRLSEETVANEIGHVNEEGQMVPIFYVATVPEPKYYDQPLHMSMESLMIQEDYKEAIKAKVAEGHERAIQPKVAAKE